LEKELKVRNENDAESFARNLLEPGFPFSIRDKENRRVRVIRKISASKSVNLMPTLERAYNLCLEGKPEKAAKLVSEIAGLLVAAEIELGPEYLVEIEMRNAMPRLLSQIRRELKNNVPAEEAPGAKTG
jgi:hypothetical protein